MRRQRAGLRPLLALTMAKVLALAMALSVALALVMAITADRKVKSWPARSPERFCHSRIHVAEDMIKWARHSSSA